MLRNLSLEQLAISSWYISDMFEIITSAIFNIIFFVKRYLDSFMYCSIIFSLTHVVQVQGNKRLFLFLLPYLLKLSQFSMYPTINPYGEFVIIDVMSFKLRRRPYEVGDVIITVSPKDPNKSNLSYEHYFNNLSISNF